MGKRTQGAGIVKGWEDKRDRIPDTFTYNKNNTITGPLTPHQLNPDSPHPIYIYIYMTLTLMEGLAQNSNLQNSHSNDLFFKVF